jgi:hypothetical protein
MSIDTMFMHLYKTKQISAQGMLYTSHGFFYPISLKLAFPYHNNIPSSFVQVFVVSLVSFSILFHFRLPKTRVAPGCGIFDAFLVTVPKAPVYKYGSPVSS